MRILYRYYRLHFTLSFLINNSPWPGLAAVLGADSPNRKVAALQLLLRLNRVWDWRRSLLYQLYLDLDWR